MTKKIKLICFDLDGTLVDTKDLHYMCLSKALKELLNYDLDYLYHKNNLCGLPTAEKLKILEIDPSRHEEINYYKQINTIAHIEKLIKPNKEIVEMLAKVKSEGYKLCVVSNCSSQAGNLMLNKSDIQQYFDLNIFKENFNLPKPYSECYARAMIYFNVFPEKTLIVEDSEYGFQSGYSLGGNIWRIANLSELNYGSLSDLLLKLNTQEVLY